MKNRGHWERDEGVDGRDVAPELLLCQLEARHRPEPSLPQPHAHRLAQRRKSTLHSPTRAAAALAPRWAHQLRRAARPAPSGPRAPPSAASLHQALFFARTVYCRQPAQPRRAGAGVRMRAGAQRCWRWA